jgi:glycine betaine/proline transport system substrate-binding protein
MPGKRREAAIRTRRFFIMKKLLAATALATLIAGPALAQEPDSCASIRFSDVGWTDITATTAAAGTVLRALGYETTVRCCRCR